MSNYLEVVNDKSNIIINDSFENLTLLRKTVINKEGDGAKNDTYTFNSSGYAGINNSTGNSDYPYWYHVLVPANPNIITFVNCELPDVPIHICDICAYETKLNAKMITVFIPKNKTVEYIKGKLTIYEFNYAGTETSQRLGLKLYGSDQKCLFDSNLKYLNIIKSMKYPDDINGASWGADKVAVHFSDFRMIIGRGSGSTVNFPCCLFNENKTFTWKRIRLVNESQYKNNIWGIGSVNLDEIDDGASREEILLYSPMLVADVTNY